MSDQRTQPPPLPKWARRQTGLPWLGHLVGQWPPRSRVAEFTHRLGLAAGGLITLVGQALFPFNLGWAFLVYGAVRSVGWIVDGLVQSGPAAATTMGRWTRCGVVGLAALYVVGSSVDEWRKYSRQAEKQATIINHCGERPVPPPQTIRRPDEVLQKLDRILRGDDPDPDRSWRDCEGDVLRAMAR